MKYVDFDNLDELPGRRLAETETFTFDCFPGISCFNRCCRNLNLFLYPYDVIRLKNRLAMSSGEFIDRHASVVLRPGGFFPDVLLRMQDDREGLCPFATPEGCAIYGDRPDTCRKFPMEEGVRYHPGAGKTERIYLFRPPDFCQGPRQARTWTPAGWAQDPDDAAYDRLTLEWAELKVLLLNDPWGREGPAGPKAKMAFMAVYNIDRFRDFVFNSSFLKRYKVQALLVKKMEKKDVDLLRFGFDWVKFLLWGIRSEKFRPR